jgi:hypothetical protein
MARLRGVKPRPTVLSTAYRTAYYVITDRTIRAGSTR